ncbi:MAG: aldolase catalytic domain-containing protein [Methylococcaceae bacterium]
MKLLDCTLRDGGYYNAWDFSVELIEDYLQAMAAIHADYVELGFRSLKIDGFKGGCAYSTDSFIKTLKVPNALKLGVMLNASELIHYPHGIEALLKRLFVPAKHSPICLVRIACHFDEFAQVLPASIFLKDLGYQVGFNVMQIAERSLTEIQYLAALAQQYPIDVLYFADSMGSLNPAKTQAIIHALQSKWLGELGIHTHDNMGLALANSMTAVQTGVTWVDSTVTGMGRGAGNVKTEYLVLEAQRPVSFNITTLLKVISKHFKSLQSRYGWGSNPYYYLAGKYAIHPSYIQEMLGDSRYSDEDILAVIEYLKTENSNQFSLNTLNTARHFYNSKPQGNWQPQSLIKNRDVLILGTGQGVQAHRLALENFIRQQKPFVIALNTQKALADELIDIRAACHPVRLLADCNEHARLPHPLVTPVSMLPSDVIKVLGNKLLLDFGLSVQADCFECYENYAILPTSLVIAYALAIATSGQARQIFLAGFDGYGGDDLRNQEMNRLFQRYREQPQNISIASITPSRYQLPASSVYALI